jgi:hypothetical protein
MRLAVTLALLALTGCAHSIPPPVTHDLLFVWNDAGNGSLPLCAAVPCTEACKSSYSVLDQNGNIIASALASATTYKLTTVPPPGSYQYSIVVNGQCVSTGSSPPTSATVTVP